VKDNIVGKVSSEFHEPHAHVGKGLCVGDAVAKNAGVGAAIIEPGDGSKALLSSCEAVLASMILNNFFDSLSRPTCIPDLEAHNRIRIGVDDALREKAGADGGSNLSRVESAFTISHNQGCLPNALGAEDDDLGFERRHYLGGGRVVLSSGGMELNPPVEKEPREKGGQENPSRTKKEERSKKEKRKEEEGEGEKR
jgi:hypothetical protein